MMVTTYPYVWTRIRIVGNAKEIENHASAKKKHDGDAEGREGGLRDERVSFPTIHSLS